MWRNINLTFLWSRSRHHADHSPPEQEQGLTSMLFLRNFVTHRSAFDCRLSAASAESVIAWLKGNMIELGLFGRIEVRLQIGETQTRFPTNEIISACAGRWVHSRRTEWLNAMWRSVGLTSPQSKSERMVRKKLDRQNDYPEKIQPD
jgi:hypothetical protein